MMTFRLSALAVAGLLTTVAACSSSYQPQIQGSYGNAYKRAYQATRAGNVDLAAEQYAFAAESGHPRALIAYGRLFTKGAGVERDPERAAELFEAAYEKNSASRSRAALELGLVLLRGGDGPSGTLEKDEERARTLLLEAFESGETRAAGSLGRIYDRGLGVDPDQGRAISYYRQAADADPNAARRLAELLIDTGAPQSEVAAAAESAVSQLETRAKGGNQGAWMQLADIYARGEIVDADPERVVGYLQRLPEDGDPKMNLRLARIYGRIGDDREQKKRLRLAADAGDASAQTALAKLFLQPGTPDTSGPVGRYYALRAIGQDDKTAMAVLGLALVRGDVLEREPLAGESLLRRAAEDGHVSATATLGASILNGDVRTRRPNEGLELLETAANQGSVSAMSSLGFAYHLGRGVAKNEELAAKWLQKAADGGSRKAAALLAKRQGV